MFEDQVVAVKVLSGIAAIMMKYQLVAIMKTSEEKIATFQLCW